MTDTATVTIDPIVVPESLEADDRGVMHAIARLGNAVALHDAGTSDLDDSAEELLPMWQDATDFVHVGYTASRDGEIAGVGILRMPASGDRTVEFDVWVDPPLWGQGIEEALLAVVEEEARRRGRHVLQTYTLHRPDTAGPRLDSPTGFGSIPAEDPQTRFLVDHGYALGQVERNSAFDLRGPYEHVETVLAESLRAAGPDYRLHEWTVPTPEHLLDGFARVRGRLATDMPAGELDIEEEVWDADRVRRREQRFAAMGMIVSITAVEHVPTGELVAYNDIGILAAEPDGVTRQFGTLVVKEHRGHRLGAIVKCANLLRWRAIAPRSPRITTFNAEENAHMLAINVELGFEPVSYAGAWKKVIAG
ncbi:GNAT family N-acetyltransferase [Microbacterium sp.]|uniref:GNAT family N-acetyltransferase n=1 Tax=Microbacterium sp. TaxID=51671 RepID=UPI0037C962D7